MKLHIPEIVWHEIGPIYSLDFQNKNDTAASKTQRFATCGRNTTIHVEIVTFFLKMIFALQFSIFVFILNVLYCVINRYGI